MLLPWLDIVVAYVFHPSTWESKTEDKAFKHESLFHSPPTKLLAT